MNVVDVRDRLARAPEYDAGETEKMSSTVHWTGNVMDPAATAAMTDDDALEYLRRFAQGHIDRDWDDAIAGTQHGSGLMYHEVIYPSGTVAITRDPLAVLWHAGDAVANRLSKAFLVLAGPRWIGDTEGRPTDAQLRSLALRLQGGGTAFGNREWSATACPGDVLQSWVEQYRRGEIPIEEEEDMTPEQDTRLKNVEAKLDDLINQQTALADNLPRVWLQRIFYGLNPYRGKRRRVDEVVPAEIVVPD